MTKKNDNNDKRVKRRKKLTVNLEVEGPLIAVGKRGSLRLAVVLVALVVATLVRSMSYNTSGN